MSRPKELFWVDVRLSGEQASWKARAGIRGGKRSSMKACLETQAAVLRFDPHAHVKIWRTSCDWKAAGEDTKTKCTCLGLSHQMSCPQWVQPL